MMGPAGYWYTLPQGCQGTSQNPLPQGGDEGRERISEQPLHEVIPSWYALRDT